MAKLQVDIIPAQPGWFVVVPVVDQYRILELEFQEVLAWRMDTNPEEESDSMVTGVSPVTLEGEAEHMQLPLVYKKPDGTFVEPMGLHFGNDISAVCRFLSDAYVGKKRK